jgi:predicted kinase
MEAVLLIGIQGSGKSTFYQQRFFRTHVRINLDMLKTRHREELLVRACIAAEQAFVVDNTNVLERERARYIAWTRPAGFRVCGYYLQTDLRDALRRNSQRPGKERIPESGVLARYRQLQPPRWEEGFDALYIVTIDPTSFDFIVREWTPGPEEGHSTPHD